MCWPARLGSGLRSGLRLAIGSGKDIYLGRRSRLFVFLKISVLFNYLSKPFLSRTLPRRVLASASRVRVKVRVKVSYRVREGYLPWLVELAVFLFFFFVFWVLFEFVFGFVSI